MMLRIWPNRYTRLTLLGVASAGLGLTSACASLHVPAVHFPNVPGAASASNAPPSLSPGYEPSSHGGLSVDAPIAKIVATPGGKTVLDQDVPGLIERPEYPLFRSMSMRKLASMSNGKISKQTLDRVNQDLTKLPMGSAQSKSP